MSRLIKMRFYLSGFYAVVTKKLSDCPGCFVKKLRCQKGQVFSVGQKSTSAHQRWECDHTHLKGFPRLRVLTFQDHWSKKVFGYLTKNETTEDVLQKLDTLFVSGHCTKPMTLAHDNGPCFRSHAFKTYLQHQDILNVEGIPYWPQGQGSVERAHKTIKRMVYLFRKNYVQVSPNPFFRFFPSLGQHVKLVLRSLAQLWSGV